MSGALRVAFLGCGGAAELHARALSPLAGEARALYASRDRARAREFAARLGGAGWFGSYAEALRSPEPDVALVLTPPPQHLELTLAALAAGKHVVVEKPAFLRAADFQTAEQAAAAAGREVLVAENYYYKPLARRLRSLVAARAVGEPRLLLVNALKRQRVGGWRADAALTGGGPFYEGGIHWVSFMAGLGLEVRSASGAVDRGQGGEERSVTALFRYAGGATGVLAHSWRVASPLRGLRLSRLYGEQGSIAFESNGLLLAVFGRRPRLWLPGGLVDLSGRVAMWRDFLRALRHGGPAEMDLARARRDLELVEEIYGQAPAGAPT